MTLHLNLANTTDIPGIERSQQVSYRLNSFFTASENKAYVLANWQMTNVIETTLELASLLPHSISSSHLPRFHV